jgi:hypothetical protein
MMQVGRRQPLQDGLQVLLAMGYAEDLAVFALEANGNDVQKAVNLYVLPHTHTTLKNVV